MRKIIFISHATPEDNDFAIWLASRLQLLGYEIWLDKTNLIGGEKFWSEIDQKIRNEAAKFLLVYSNNICVNNTPGILKDGIFKELSLAESISKKEKLGDFVVLLNIDPNASENLFIGANAINQIPFYESWADGLRILQKKLEKENIPTTREAIDNSFANWYENEYITKNIILPKKELYYSNWWSIPELPDFFYLHHFENEAQAQSILSINSKYPIIRAGNILATFNSELLANTVNEWHEQVFKPKEIYKIKVCDIASGFESFNFPSHKDAENLLKRILNRVFHLMMKEKGLFWTEFSSRKLVYFYPLRKLHKNKVSFSYSLRPPHRNNKKTKTLVGRYLSLGNWHFGISEKVITKPFFGYSLKTHILFTSNGFEVWNDKNKMHTHRRKKGKNLFNEEWRDMLYAFLNSLDEKSNKIQIPLSDDFVLKMPLQTEIFWSDFGYLDPRDKSRQDILNHYEDNEEENPEQIYETDQ